MTTRLGLISKFAAFAAAVMITAVLFGGSASANTVTGAGSVNPTDIISGGSAQVELTLTGETITSSTPTDVMLVIDESGSLDPTEFSQQMNFAENVVNSLADAGLFDNGGSAGLVMFGTTARTVLPLDSDQAAVIAAINSVIQFTGWTCIGCGINNASAEFTANSAPGNNRVMIVMTDGANNRPIDVPGETPATYLTDAINTAEGLGVERFAVGVGNAVVQSELVQIASDPTADHVFEVTDFDALEDLLTELVEAVTAPGGTDIEVEANVDSRFSVSNESADKGTASVSGNTVTWNIDALGDETATLTYDVSVDCTQGGGALPVHDSISYTDNEGNVVDLSTLGLTVNLRGCAADVALAPGSDTNPVGDDHNVTATVTDDFGDAVEGVEVTFNVTSGPNAGATGSDTTDANGEASFTYTGAYVLGTDTIVASFEAADGSTVDSNTAEKTWVDITAPELDCAEGVNPSGKNVPEAGNKSPGQNEDGFYELSATDDLDGDVEIWVSGFGPFQSGDVVKITEAPGATPKMKSMGGAVTAHLTLDSDAVVTATDSSGNSSSISCLVPPDPK